MPNSTSPEGAEPLSAEDRQLLAAAREQRQRERVPDAVRERLLARALEDANRTDPSRVVPAAQFVAVQPRGLGFTFAGVGLMALAVALLTPLRGWLRGSTGDAGEGAGGAPLATESPADRADTPLEKLGGRLFASALFRAPAPAFSAALPPPEASLLGERPFSAQSRAWQVRRWDDLSTDPSEPAQYELTGGALCVALGNSERVIGGWPWGAAAGSAPPVAVQKSVRLDAGKSYRLIFRAWAREPLPAQVLIAVGHDRVPFSAAAGARVVVSTTPQAFAVSFRPVHDDPSIGVAFMATAADDSERTRLCLSDVTLTEAPPL
jgi:hypothetical protein